jgi:hypothetical protein
VELVEVIRKQSEARKCSSVTNVKEKLRKGEFRIKQHASEGQVDKTALRQSESNKFAKRWEGPGSVSVQDPPSSASE